MIIEDTQRYVRIRSKEDCTEYISTQDFHETLIFFRRIEKLYKDGILKKIDLADMWREILPFGISGRLLFMSSYFSKEDAEPIAFVVLHTLMACKKYEIKKSLEYFKKGYDKEKQCFHATVEEQNEIIEARNRKIDEFNMDNNNNEKKDKEEKFEVIYEEFFTNNNRFKKSQRMKVRKFKKIVESIT